jgi:2-isopropylmalate synthase
MRYKWGKVMNNIRSAVGAITNVSRADSLEIAGFARKELNDLLDEAGIAYVTDAQVSEEWPEFTIKSPQYVSGEAQSSSWQSLARQHGSVETEFFNGEVVRLAKKLGKQAPINDGLNRIMQEMAANREIPGKYTTAELKKILGLENGEDNMKPWDVEGKWSISNFGWEPEVRREMPLLRKKVGIRDVTLREGDDCVGYRVSIEDKIELLRLSVKMGIEEIDIGKPSKALAAALKESGIKVRKTGSIPGGTKDFKRDVDLCMESGSDNLRVAMRFVNEKMALEQLKTLPAIVDYAHSQYKAEVNWGISDTPRVPLELIRKVCREGLAAGADKALISDTYGVATPEVMRYLASEVRAIIPAEMGLKIHCHDTFGMATANTIAAAVGGGTELDCTINGYGDEAGNAPLEEVVMSLEALYGVDTGLNISLLNKYSRLAIEKGQIPIQPHKAIVGENAFLKIWSGIDKAKESEMPHEPLSAHLVGTNSNVVFGPQGSLDDTPIEMKFKELGIPCTPMGIVKARETVERMLQEERTIKVRRKYVTEAEFEDILRNMDC